MEVSLQKRRQGLLTKIPDIEQTLSVVTFLRRRRRKDLGEADEANGDNGDDGDEMDDMDDMEEETKAEGSLKTLFELNDTLYAEAEVDETGEVGLWLGVSYRGTVLELTK